MSKILNILSKIFVGLIALFAVLFSSCSFFKFKTSCDLLGLSTYREVSSGVGVVIEDGLDVTTGELKLFENLEEGSDFISIKVPINLDGSISYTLPVEAGRKDYVLTWQEGNIMQWKDISSISSIGGKDLIQVVSPAKELSEEVQDKNENENQNQDVGSSGNVCTNVVCSIPVDLDLQNNVFGTLSLGNGGTGSSLEGPGEDRILFWDESMGKVRWLKIGDNLDINDRTLNADSSSDDSGGSEDPVEIPVSYTGEIYTAGNGLYVSGSEVRLGGILSQNTTISQGDRNMIFNLTGFGDFDIQDNGVSSLYVSGSSGKIGIGTTNPTSKMDIYTNLTAPAGYFSNLSSRIDLNPISASTAYGELTGMRSIVYVSSSVTDDLRNTSIVGAGITVTHSGDGDIRRVGGLDIRARLNSGSATYGVEGVSLYNDIRGLGKNTYTPLMADIIINPEIVAYSSGGNTGSVRVDDVYGIYDSVAFSVGDTSSLTMNNLYGFYTLRGIYKEAGATANITNKYDIYLDEYNGGANITNNYGLYIKEKTSGINDFNIYSIGGRNYFGGTVGIGITSPGSYKLNVAGSFIATDYFSGDGTRGADATVNGLVFKDGLYTSGTFTDQNTTYTASNGLTLSGTEIQLGGTLLKSTSIVQGNYNMVYNLTGTGSFDIQDSGVSSLYVSGSNGNVGIGTTNPQEKLDVVGGNIRTDSTLIAGGAVFGYATGSGVTDRIGGSAKFMTGTGYIYFDRNNSQITMNETTGDLSGHAYSDDLGWIDFGEVENPSGPVNVNLTSGSVTGKAYVISSGSYVDFTNYSSNVTVNLTTGIFSGYVWAEEAGWVDFTDSGVYFSNNTITTFAADQNLYINPEGDGVTFISGNVTIDGTAYASAFSSNSPLRLQTAGIDRLYIDDTSGYVGIGTTSPEYMLDVNGTIRSGDLLTSAGISYNEHLVEMGQIGLSASPFLVEKVSETTFRAGSAVSPSTASLSDGSILIAYEDPYSDDSGNFVIYDSLGNLVVSETTFNADNTSSISTTTLTNGNILIAYNDNSSNEGSFVIYDSAGNLVKSETTFDVIGVSYISTSTLTNGNVLIAYKGSSEGNFVIYDSLGNQVVSKTTFNDSSSMYVSTTTLTNGNVLIAYHDALSKGNFVIFDSAGNLVKSETTFNSANTNYISTTTLNNGNILISYQDFGSSSYGNFVIYDSAGNLVKSETTFYAGTTYDTSAITLTNGNILIAYTDASSSFYGNFVIYDSTGNLVVSETTFNAGNTFSSSATTLTNGNILIAFTDSGDSEGAFVIYGSSGVSFANMVGIGTTNPTASLHVAGTLRFSNFGAGTLTTDASGNVSVSSDERLKDIQGSFDRGLEEILQLDPILYKWNDASGMETETVYAGLSAQNVQSVIPEAVGVSSDGYLTLSDRPILSATINAIKEQQLQIEELRNILIGEGKILESTESSESIPTTDTGILAEIQALYQEFKDMILALGMTSHIDELGNNYLSIDSDVKMAGDLSVLGETTTSNLTVTGNIQMGLITVNTKENSIDVLGVSCYNEDTGEESEYCTDTINDPSLSTLYLQKSSSGNLNIFNGKLVIEPNGTMTLDGDFQVKGTIKTEKLIIKDSEKVEEGADNFLTDDSCEEGEISWDDDFIYVCTSSGEWKKSPLYDKDLDID